MIQFILYCLFTSQQQLMRQDSQIDFQKYQLYTQYFSKCKELSFISKPFSLDLIGEQIGRRDLQSQFQLIRALSETKKHKLKLRVNSVLQNKKNRYPEQSIYQHSRVKLNAPQRQDYINANWIPLAEGRKLIITQGPLEQTQNQFEQMVAQNEIECVVMLCNIIQNGKVRCFDYTDNRQKDEVTNGPISISNVSLSNRKYVHIHYSCWPDKSVPEDKQEIKQLLEHIVKYRRVAIHCSAGLGRSGVIAALLSIILQIKGKQKNISIFETVLRLRQHRFGAIQNSEQYTFVYSFLEFFSLIR